MRLFALLSSLSLAALAAAAEPAAPALPLAQALRLARERNPEIQAARQDWEKAKAEVLPQKTWQAPQVGVEYYGFSGASLGAAPEKWYDFSQEVPFPGKLRLRGATAAHEADRQEDLYLSVQLDVLERVKQAYYRYLYVTKAKRILDENVEVMRRLAGTAEARYATGKTPQVDVLRAQVELSKTLAALLLLEQDQTAARARLNALLDQAPGSALGVPQDPDLSPLSLSEADLQRAASSRRPELRVARHHIEHTTSALTAQRAEYLPDFMLQYTRRTRDGMPDDSIAMIKMSLPFLYFWRPHAQVRAADAQLTQAQDMLRSEEDRARADVDEDWSKVQAAGRLVELYRTSILPQAEQAEKVAEAAYQAGRVDFLTLMDAQRALLEFRLDDDQYVAQYGDSVAQLERALGVELSSVAGAAHEGVRHDHE